MGTCLTNKLLNVPVEEGWLAGHHMTHVARCNSVYCWDTPSDKAIKMGAPIVGAPRKPMAPRAVKPFCLVAANTR